MDPGEKMSDINTLTEILYPKPIISEAYGKLYFELRTSTVSQTKNELGVFLQPFSKTPIEIGSIIGEFTPIMMMNFENEAVNRLGFNFERFPLETACLLEKRFTANKTGFVSSKESTKFLKFCSIVNQLHPRDSATISYDDNSDVFIDKMTRKINLNSFRVGTTSGAVFYMPSFFNHSCIPNCWYVIDQKTGFMKIIAIRRIEPGEELTITYYKKDLSSREMRMQILNGWFKECRCESCKNGRNIITLSKIFQDFERVCLNCAATIRSSDVSNNKKIHKCINCQVAHFCSKECYLVDKENIKSIHKKIWCEELANELKSGMANMIILKEGFKADVYSDRDSKLAYIISHNNQQQ